MMDGTVRDERLFCQVLGDSGTPVVFLHGLGLSSRYWLPRVESLSKEFRLVVPDLLGFGRSPWPEDLEYSIEQHVTAIWRLLEAQQVTGQQPVLVGHSLGAILALATAAKHTSLIRRLVLISLPYYHDEVEAATHMTRHSFLNEMVIDRGAFAQIGTWLMSSLPVAMHTLGPVLLSRIPHDLAEDVMNHHWTAFNRTHKQCIVKFRLEASLDAVRALPVLMIHGEVDPIAPVGRVQELSHMFSNIRVITVPDASHHPLLTHPEPVLERLGRFLRGAPVEGERARAPQARGKSEEASPDFFFEH